MNKIYSLIFMLIVLSGCAALLVGGAAGAGAATYLAGEMKASFKHDMDTVWQATEQAANQLQFDVQSARADQTSGRLEATNAADKNIQINLKRVELDVTEVRIRVGLIGDKDLSAVILDKIRENIS